MLYEENEKNLVVEPGTNITVIIPVSTLLTHFSIKIDLKDSISIKFERPKSFKISFVVLYISIKYMCGLKKYASIESIHILTILLPVNSLF